MADRILRLITKSNLAGCNTGKSADFAPLRISCGEELHWSVKISWSRRDAGLLEVNLKVPPAVDQFLSLLGRQCADEMPAHEVKDCIAGLLAAEGVDHDAVPAV